MRMMHWLEKRASLTPDRNALVTEDGSVTFAQLRERSHRSAHKLAQLGVGKNDHIALLCHNSMRVPELVHAIHYLGAVVVPLNIRLTASELAYQLQDARCALLIHDEAL